MRRSSNKRSKRSSRGKNNLSVQVPTREIISHPPQINGLELRHSVTLRYTTNAAVTDSAITFRNLVDTLLVAVTTTSGVDLFEAVRIRRVRLWASSALGSAVSVKLEYSGVTTGLIGDQAIHTDTSMGVQPAFVQARPSARSLASDWQLGGAGNTSTAMLITGPSGTVVDVELSFRSQFLTPNATAGNALVAATVGSQYIRGLDGLPTATSKYVPELSTAQI